MCFDFSERTELIIDSGRLKDKAVAVFGLGGVGSYAAEALVRAGVGHIIICDNDRITKSNINRQLLALHSTVGRSKAGVAVERYLDINGQLDIHAFDIFILPENAAAFFDGLMIEPDFVADCIDTVSGKLAVIGECRKRGIELISCMGTGNKIHPEMFRISDIRDTKVCPLCRVMRRELKERGVEKLTVLYSEEQPRIKGEIVGSISTVPSVAGLMIADYIIKELMK